MRLPIRSKTRCNFTVDDDGLEISQAEVFAAINHAATGPWEKGPVPDGEKGDKMLFLYIDSYENFRIDLVKWSVIAHGWWMRAANATAAQPDMFAHINIPKVEKRKGEKNDDNTN